MRLNLLKSQFLMKMRFLMVSHNPMSRKLMATSSQKVSLLMATSSLMASLLMVKTTFPMLK